MSYATIDDIRKQIREAELISLTDENDTGAVDQAVVDNAIASASAEIDGYLGSRYDLPLATVPDVIRKLCVDIAVFNLYALGHGPPDSRQSLYNNAVDFLRRVSEGRISLGADDPDGTGSSETVEITGPGRIFDRDKLKGW